MQLATLSKSSHCGLLWATTTPGCSTVPIAFLPRTTVASATKGEFLTALYPRPMRKPFKLPGTALTTSHFPRALISTSMIKSASGTTALQRAFPSMWTSRELVRLGDCFWESIETDLFIRHSKRPWNWSGIHIPRRRRQFWLCSVPGMGLVGRQSLCDQPCRRRTLAWRLRHQPSRRRFHRISHI